MKSIELFLESTDRKGKTDGMHQIDLCILSLGRRNWIWGGRGDTVRKETLQIL